MLDHCPICLSPDDVRPLLVKNACQLQRCTRCDHIFVAPQPKEEEMTGLYSFAAGYQKQSTVRYSENQVFPRKARRSLEQITRHVPSGGTLLDVGCSSGRFLFLARRHGYRVQGVELNPDTAAIARANGLPVFVGKLEAAGFPPASFDVVHLGDIIEHVRDPASLLDQVRELLKPGGIAIIVTPNHDALFPRATYALYRAVGVPWSHPTPPHHLHQFSFTSLTALLEHRGLRVVETRFAPCSLAYELRSTGAFRPLKQAGAERRPLRLLLHGTLCAGVTLAYAGVWAIDRAAILKHRDFEMRLVATAPDPGAESPCVESERAGPGEAAQPS